MTNPIDDEIRNVLARQAAALTPPDWHPGDAPTLGAREPEAEPGWERRQTWWLAAAALAVLALTGAILLATRDDTVTSTGPAGTGGDSTDGTGPDRPITVPSTTGASTTVPPTTDAPTTAPTSAVDTTAPTTTASTGQWFDMGPEEGTAMDVVGVRHDDVLNLRSRPEAGAPIVATAAPLADVPDIRSAGEGRLFTGRSAWWKVTVDGKDAWANQRYLGALGGTEDIFAELSTTLPSLEWNGFDDLISAIVAIRGPAEGGVQPTRVDDVAPPTPTTRVFDLVGFADDSIRGERISITVQTVNGRTTLVGAQRTLICARGVSGSFCL